MRPLVERIVATAVAMIDADGLDGFSMRKLGRQLRADPMAVYHYFPSKAALFDTVVESVYCEIDFAGVDEASWDEAVASYGNRQRRYGGREALPDSTATKTAAV